MTKSPSLGRAVLAAALLAVAAPRTAAADDEEEGRRRFEHGQELYDAGKYREAMREFQAGYAAFPRSGFLVSIGQCYRKVGDLPKARTYFRKYLDLEPDSSLAPKIQKMVQEIDAQIGAPAGEAPEPEPPVSPVPRAPSPPPAPRAAPAAPAPPPPPRAAPAAPAPPPPPPPPVATPVPAAPAATPRPPPPPPPPEAPAEAAPADPGDKTDEALMADLLHSLQSSPPPPPPTVTRPAPVRKPPEPKSAGHTWLWVLLGAAIVAGGAGAFYLDRRSSSGACGSLGCWHE